MYKLTCICLLGGARWLLAAGCSTLLALCLLSCTLPCTVIPRDFRRGFSSSSCSTFPRSSAKNLSTQPAFVKSSCLSSCEQVGRSLGSSRRDHWREKSNEHSRLELSYEVHNYIHICMHMYIYNHTHTHTQHTLMMSMTTGER